jgi:hypothetical protein
MVPDGCARRHRLPSARSLSHRSLVVHWWRPRLIAAAATPPPCRSPGCAHGAPTPAHRHNSTTPHQYITHRSIASRLPRSCSANAGARLAGTAVRSARIDSGALFGVWRRTGGGASSIGREGSPAWRRKDQRHVGLDPELPGCRPTQQWWVALLLGPDGFLASSATLAAFASPPTKLPCRRRQSLNRYKNHLLIAPSLVCMRPNCPSLYHSLPLTCQREIETPESTMVYQDDEQVTS